ncbi:MAG TPA: alpha/beta hydrolase [Blastocatellia bacterium]|nr:alpha/beta hydrolase [Blastocatellia bacterium]HMZ18896.1 alpha/beta hydrolase [Blastocatellia bacterium]HNG29622.1 alpha/beta hydrolase [Blastocatellia bacterium]
MTKQSLLIAAWLCCALFAVAAKAELRKDIEFAKPDGVSLTLDAFVPEGAGPFPTVIIVHGGGFARGDKQTYVPPLFEPLSQAGFTWFTINYRLHPQVKFPAPIDDVEAAISFVKAHAKEYKVDLKRVVLMGESAGGSLVSFVGVRNKSAIKLAAVVPFYGVHDWQQRAEEDAAGKGGASIWRDFFSVPQGSSPEAVKRMREVSAATYIKKGLPPFLLIHGTKDEQVNYQQSVVMQQRMKQAGNVCDLITVEGGPHGMGVITKFPDTQVKMIAWLKTTLKLK